MACECITAYSQVSAMPNAYHSDLPLADTDRCGLTLRRAIAK